MADFTLTIPDDQVDRVVSALCQSVGSEVSNDAAKAAVIDYINRVVCGMEQAAAQAAALAAATPPAPVEMS